MGSDSISLQCVVLLRFNLIYLFFNKGFALFDFQRDWACFAALLFSRFFFSFSFCSFWRCLILLFRNSLLP